MDDLDFDKAFAFRLSAGVACNNYEAQKKKTALDAKRNRHWKKGVEFSERTLTKEAWRLCPYYSGSWNPVMWSDYPKQPAWTVPLPQMAASSVSNSCRDGPIYRCHPVTPEIVSKVHCSHRMPVPRKTSQTCRRFPYLGEQTIPFKDFRECPCPRNPEMVVDWKRDFTCGGGSC